MVHIRKWLISNRASMSPECANFFSDLGVKQKGFLKNLRKWMSQYKQRQEFINKMENRGDEEWISCACEAWEALGGVYVRTVDGPGVLAKDDERAAFSVGVVTHYPANSSEHYSHVIEASLPSQKQMSVFIRLLDSCAIPVVGTRKPKTNEVATIFAISSPSTDPLNRKVKDLRLPTLANALL